MLFIYSDVKWAQLTFCQKVTKMVGDSVPMTGRFKLHGRQGDVTVGPLSKTLNPQFLQGLEEPAF